MINNKKELLKCLDNIYWVDDASHFNTKSEYPSLFEQKYGNLSSTSIHIKNHLVPEKHLQEIHEFFEKNSFNATRQYNIHSYEIGHYFSDDLSMLVSVAINPMQVSDDVVVSFDFETPRDSEGILIVFTPLKKNQDKILNFLKEFFDLEYIFEYSTQKEFYMISQNSQGLTKLKTSFNDIPILDDRYDLYYGDGFPYDKMLDFVTNEETESLLMLHGLPGTGKSNFIKNLITKCAYDVIYIPPSMVSVISQPSFISFMLDNRGSVLLIEDAEEILSVDRNSGTQNILGITDGFLKDSMKMKVICTFNCELTKIDPALLRKGRLFMEYKFDKLSIAECQRLADHCDLDIEVDSEMTLAELFNHDKVTSTENSFEERKIGFF